MNPDSIITAQYIHTYFLNLVNAFYKILPMSENKEPTRVEYMCSLLREMLGMQGLVESIEYDTGFFSLLNILQYFIDNPDCDDLIVKRDVFRAISICKRIASKYCTEAMEVRNECLEKV